VLRHDLCVLNYVVASNHIHLVVRDRGRGEVAASMELLEGCTGSVQPT
jgi:putative transposase